MEETPEKEEHVLPPQGVSGDLSGKPISFYFHLFKWPVLGASLVEMVLIALNVQGVYLWFINLLLFVILTVWAKSTYEIKLGQVVILGSSAGLVLGFLVALFKLIWLHKLYLFFNLITETVITALAGLLICGGTYLVMTKEYKEEKKSSLFKFFKKKEKKDKFKKGGGN